MRLKVLPLLFLLLLYSFTSAQVGIGISDPKAALDIEVNDPSAPLATDGLLIPRLDALPSVDPGDDQHAMLIFLTSASGGKFPGFHYWDKNRGSSGEWVALGLGWKITGNDDAIAGTHFIGTTNNQEVDFRVNNKLVATLTELGQFEIQADGKSILIGVEAGENYDPAGSDAEQNVFVGYHAARLNNSGRDNVAVGTYSMQNTDSGDFNTAVGDETLFSNTTGSRNTAIGKDALHSNTRGNSNSAFGSNALMANTTGDDNTAMGFRALVQSVGSDNTAFGNNAGDNLITGDNNTFIGNEADATVTSLTNSTAIGNEARVSASNQIIVGNSAITQIGGYVGWSNVSDERFKYQIKDNVPGIDFIGKLRTVTYNLDRAKLGEFRGESALSRNDEQRHTGFLAQQVEKVAQDIGFEFNGVKRPSDLDKDNYTVSYATFVVPLVKTVQEQQDQIEAQRKEIDELKALLHSLIDSK